MVPVTEKITLDFNGYGVGGLLYPPRTLPMGQNSFQEPSAKRKKKLSGREIIAKLDSNEKDVKKAAAEIIDDALQIEDRVTTLRMCTITCGSDPDPLLLRWTEGSKGGQQGWWCALKSSAWLKVCSPRRLFGP